MDESFTFGPRLTTIFDEWQTGNFGGVDDAVVSPFVARTVPMTPAATTTAAATMTAMPLPVTLDIIKTSLKRISFANLTERQSVKSNTPVALSMATLNTIAELHHKKIAPS
ncbi:MAG: hypothetical protein ACYDB2_12045 [Acidimicrobiales bacterium]